MSGTKLEPSHHYRSGSHRRGGIDSDPAGAPSPKRRREYLIGRSSADAADNSYVDRTPVDWPDLVGIPKPNAGRAAGGVFARVVSREPIHARKRFLAQA